MSRTSVTGMDLIVNDRVLKIQSAGNMDLISTVKEVIVDQNYSPSCLSFHIKKNSVVIDIGANIGIFSMYAASFAPRIVLAVEPVSLNYKGLVQNIKINNFSNIAAIQSAVSDVEKDVEILIFEKEMTGCRIASPLLDKQSDNNRAKEKVHSTTIKKIMTDHGLGFVDFLKLDCEGEEYSILHGLDRETMDKIACIAAEYHDNTGKGFSADLAQYLKNNGFSVEIKQGNAHPELGYIYAWK